jgi:hypothetical protein
VKIAALVVGGIYAYRRFTEGTAAELEQTHAVTPLPQFVISWGVVFFTLSLLAGPVPTLAGNMAILVMLASLLSNGTHIAADLQKGVKHGKVPSELPKPGHGKVAGPPTPHTQSGPALQSPQRSV